MLATLRRVAIVDRSALLVSLVRRTNAINAGRKVDGKTWRRLVDRMVDRGDAAAGELACDGEADPVAVLYLPSAAIPMPLGASPQAAEFRRRRAAARAKPKAAPREKRARETPEALLPLAPPAESSSDDEPGEPLSFAPRRVGQGHRLKGAPGGDLRGSQIFNPTSMCA